VPEKKVNIVLYLFFASINDLKLTLKKLSFFCKFEMYQIQKISQGKSICKIKSFMVEFLKKNDIFIFVMYRNDLEFLFSVYNLCINI